MNKGWIAVDLDGTLALYEGWNGINHIGQPIPKMLERVKKWLAEGKTVKIMTARCCEPSAVPPIKKWLKEHLGQELEVVREKDYDTEEIWDDRAKQVIKNTGETLFTPSQVEDAFMGWISETIFEDGYLSQLEKEEELETFCNYLNTLVKLDNNSPL